MNISPTTILSLAQMIISILAIFGITINKEAANQALELGIAAFTAVSGFIIYIRRIQKGDVNIFGGRKKV